MNITYDNISRTLRQDEYKFPISAAVSEAVRLSIFVNIYIKKTIRLYSIENMWTLIVDECFYL